jgi:hypothetical protein
MGRPYWDCGWEAAKRGSAPRPRLRGRVGGPKLFGMEAGNDCWIPNPGAVSIEQVVGRSGGPNAACGDNATGGIADGLRLYTLDDANMARLQNKEVEYGKAYLRSWTPREDRPYPPSNMAITDMGCWSGGGAQIMPEGGAHRMGRPYWDCGYEAAKLGSVRPRLLTLGEPAAPRCLGWSRARTAGSPTPARCPWSRLWGAAMDRRPVVAPTEVRSVWSGPRA